MPHRTTTDAAPPRADGRQDGSFRDGLELIAEGVTEIVGFNLACISVVRTAADGTKELEVIALAGHDFGNEMVVGRRTPLAGLLKELENAEDWGHFQFLPHELLETDVENAYGWVVPDLVPLDVPDAWHPLDLLVALLHDDQGTLRGSLAIDLPENGLRPGPEQRRLLEKFAAQAGRAVVTHLEREELAEKVRLADAARTIVRNASAQQELAVVLEQCQQGLVDGFRAGGSWIQTFDEDGRGSGAIYTSGTTDIVLPDELVDLAERTGRTCWTEQRSVILTSDHPAASGLLSEREQRAAVGFLDSIGVRSVLFVPLGAGAECLGNLVLTRSDSHDWTELDCQAALDIGHDLGRVVLNARTFERDRELVRELQALDTYKSELIATVSHELKNPLTAITGYAELLEGSPDLGDRSRGALQAINRGISRLTRVIDDLLLLAKVEDPQRPLVALPVDLRPVVDEALDLLDVTIRQKQLDVTVEAPDRPVAVLGDADELDRMVTNLVSNAVKYTSEGRVEIGLATFGDQVTLQVHDEGLGISQADQERLFTEFFRSTNPQAVRQPGTGLGLAIVKRIVQRHDGEISLKSDLGDGSTFTVRLPAAG